MVTQPNSAAFPTIGRGGVTHDEGLTQRAWFAGMALAVVAQYPTARTADLSETDIAECAVKIADALVARLAEDEED